MPALYRRRSILDKDTVRYRIEPSARGGRLRLGIGEFRLKLCCNHLRKERASDERPDDRLDVVPGEPAR